jgi:DNA-binding XRE family transcriptional regulator
MLQPSDRLKEAREKAGFDSAKAAAEAMGAAVATYIQHENGTRGFPAKAAERYATFFRTTPEWLLYARARRGSGAPPGLSRIIGRVGADASGSVIMTTAHESWDMAPPPPGGTPECVALDVRGDSMHTFAENGALIYFEDQRAPLDPELIGVPCVVETEDGRVLVKRPKRGSQPGLYDLESDFGPVMRDVRLVWAAEIIAVIPPRQARRIIVKASDAA